MRSSSRNPEDFPKIIYSTNCLNFSLNSKTKPFLSSHFCIVWLSTLKCLQLCSVNKSVQVWSIPNSKKSYSKKKPSITTFKLIRFSGNHLLWFTIYSKSTNPFSQNTSERPHSNIFYSGMNASLHWEWEIRSERYLWVKN